MIIREYSKCDSNEFLCIWNEIVEEGVAFPQDWYLTSETIEQFIKEQSYVGIAKDGEQVVGLYILHPNNVGRCGHICNASFAVTKSGRGLGVGKSLVQDCLQKAKELSFEILQFNAVVKTNKEAISLYENLGFNRVGMIPQGFHKDDGYEDIYIYYYKL